MLRARENIKKTKKRPKKKTESERTRISKDSEKNLRSNTEKGYLLHSTTVKPVYNGHPWEMAR